MNADKTEERRKTKDRMKETEDKAKRAERKERFATLSGIPLEAHYSAADADTRTPEAEERKRALVESLQK